MGILDSVRKQIQKAAEDAMYEAEGKGYLLTLQNLSDFYSQGNPKVYRRTGKLGNTPETTGVLGSGNHLEARIYLNTQYYYDDRPSYIPESIALPGRAAPWVISQAEIGAAGILGKPGFWAKSEKDIEDAFYDALKKRFG